MAKEEDHLDKESQERFEQQMFSLLRKKEIYFPQGAIYPEREQFEEAIPVRKSLVERWAGFMNGLGRWFLKPAVAYALALLLIYPAYLGLFRKPEVRTQVVKEKEIVRVPERIGGLGTAQDVRLGTARRSEEREKEIVLSKTDGFFTLSFFVPIETRSNIEYNLEIRGENGELVGEQKNIISRDGLGNFSLVCSKQLFNDGHYILKVHKVNKATSKTEQDYTFKFKIVQSTK